MDRLSKKAERFALVRVAFWVLMLPVIVCFGWQGSVFLVLCLSLYANAATDWSDYHVAKHARKQKEDSDGGSNSDSIN